MQMAATHLYRGQVGPQIVVIIPVYGHPVLLSEAVESVLAQQCQLQIGVVIVSDGCRMEETDLIASAYATAHQSIVYLRKRNGGPSSARNYGIDFALRTWPEMMAAYFLDSDNRLTPSAMEDAWRVMSDNPGVGWVYPNIDSFGISWSANYGIPYSPLLHIAYDNICDTGSLVARAVLEAGVRFDEDARSGYEDWDFWLQCLKHGFLGKHAPFGFSYRQRPESRYREMNRQRGTVIEHLRRRHWSIAAPRSLLRWEHETNPRTLLTLDNGISYFAFTDPTDLNSPLTPDAVVEQFHASCHQPDEVLLWPFIAFSSAGHFEALTKMKVIHSIFALMERESSRTSFVAVTLRRRAGEIDLEIGPPSEPSTLHRRAVIWMCRGRQIADIVAASETAWANSLATAQPQPGVVEICISAPWELEEVGPEITAVGALLDLIARLRESPMRAVSTQRWNWRSAQFPARERYYELVCKYVQVTALMPRLASTAIDVGLVVPIASFGGAEKVAYAMARYLRGLGARLHLFVVGKPNVKLLSEFEEAFDTINFLADPSFPVWGGPMTIMGQGCFSPDSPEIKAPDLAGMLVNLDLVVNCHSAPMNSIMGALRAKYRAKTAAYLHVFDFSPLKMPVGHPYLTLAFEHAYDLVLTCSRQLADQMHSLGVPIEKIMPIANAPGFSISEEVRAAQREWRARPRKERRLNVLYLGRLDPQKGVERLLYAARLLAERRAPVEIRVVGAGLIEEGGNWGEALHALGVSVEPPIFDSAGLADAYAWADVLLLPSRWEGAPLVIAECHQLGCIPIATRVGAVDELTTDGVDGFLIESGPDDITADAMVARVEQILANDEMRARMAKAGMTRGEENLWSKNFEPLGAWFAHTFGSTLEGRLRS